MLLDTHLQKIAWSNFFAQFSEQIALAAAPLVAVLFLAASASDTAWLQAVQTLPFLICAIPAGLIVDRMSRRTLMISVEIGRTLILSILMMLFILKLLTYSLLIILGFIAAIGTVCYSVATPAYIPTIIAKDELMTANRWLELVRSIAFSAGPALCGVIVANLGMPIAYAIAIVFSIITLIFLMLLPKDDAPQITVTIQQKRNIKQELMEGWRFIRHNDYLRAILLTAIFFNTAWFIIQGVFVAYAMNTLHFSAQNVGIILGIYGIGMLLGALTVKPLSNRASVGFMIVLGPIGGFLGAVMMLLTLWFPSIFFAGLSYFLLGFGPTIWAVTTLSLRQVITPSNMMGRVTALILTVSAGTRPIGAGIAALFAAYIGVESCLWLAVIGFTIQLMIIITSKIPALNTLTEAAA